MSVSQLWIDIKNAYFSYNGLGINLFFLFVCIIYILILNQKKHRNLLIYEIFGILLLMTPGIANCILKAGDGAQEGWMLYGILNVAAVVAYVAVKYLMEIQKKSEKVLILVMYIILLQAGMNINYTGNHFMRTTNLYKISQETIQIAKNIDHIEQPRILAPESVGSELREYDTKYAVIYGEGLSFTQDNIDQLQIEIASYGCNCVILNTEYENQEILNNIGFSKIKNTEHYVVYAK